MGSQLLGLVDHEGALQSIATVLNGRTGLQKRLLAVSHRVVHGGETFSASSQIDDRVLSGIESCNPLPPLHNPANPIAMVVPTDEELMIARETRWDPVTIVVY